MKALKGKISIQQAKEAIEFLVARGYLLEERGVLRQSNAPLASTDAKADSLVRLNHRETVTEALSSIDLPLEERGVFGLTLAFSEERMPWVKERTRRFVEEMREELAFDPKASTVYRIQAQCFPMAWTGSESGSAPVLHREKPELARE